MKFWSAISRPIAISTWPSCLVKNKPQIRESNAATKILWKYSIIYMCASEPSRPLVGFTIYDTLLPLLQKHSGQILRGKAIENHNLAASTEAVATLWVAKSRRCPYNYDFILLVVDECGKHTIINWPPPSMPDWALYGKEHNVQFSNNKKYHVYYVPNVLVDIHSIVLKKG